MTEHREELYELAFRRQVSFQTALNIRRELRFSVMFPGKGFSHEWIKQKEETLDEVLTTLKDTEERIKELS